MLVSGVVEAAWSTCQAKEARPTASVTSGRRASALPDGGLGHAGTELVEGPLHPLVGVTKLNDA
jgi:hypothetical protein